MRIAPLLLAIPLMLSGCGGDAPPPTRSASATATSGTQEAESRIGDAVVHASVVQTSTLDAAVASQYGLERSDRIAMVLVSVRRADGADGPAPDVRIDASAGPADGAVQPLALREVQVAGLTDRVGTVDIAPPESIRFQLVLRYGNSTSTMDFTREFFAR